MSMEFGRLSPETAMQKVSGLLFAMRANGFSPKVDDGLWVPNRISEIERDLAPLSYLFRSSEPKNWSFINTDPKGIVTAMALKDRAVGRMIDRFCDLDEESARRISFLLGFVCRYLHNGIPQKLSLSTEFVSAMTNLGSKKSGEAIAAAMAMHILNGHSITQDNNFKGEVYHMAEAMEKDPVTVSSTADFGLFQATRLWRFIKKTQKDNGQEIIPPFLLDYLDAFCDFPTIGAEFHIQFSSYTDKSFWQRVALLNISQYLRGSYIPFSRQDEGIIEIRMNPSTYPVAIANWNLMRLFLPELNNSYFTISLNRPEGDFVKIKDQDVIHFLHILGVFSYATFFRQVPQIKTPQQVNFGDYYLGQTVTFREGKFNLTGNYLGGNNGKEGQLNICTGFGNLFPHLAFYLSMALADPSLPRILSPRFSKINNIWNVLNLRERDIRGIFVSLNNLIENNKRLNQAAKTGPKIIEAFRP